MTDKIAHVQDQLLVIDAQAGSRVALEELVRRWYTKLWQYACNLTLDQPAAWDIAQESWYDIIRGLRRLNDPAHFKAWAYKITTHRAMDWLRDQRRHQHTSLSSIEPPCACQEEDSDLLEDMHRLKEKSRLVLSLYYLENLTVAEISIALDIPAGTVKSRLYKARQELRLLWENTP
jgi:RNA polymerase sigma factor (sigma-70 family)